MSEYGQNRPTGDRQVTKSEKRAAAKAAAVKAAEARKRRQALLGALAGLAVVAVIVGAFVFFGEGSKNSTDQAGATPSATSGAGQPEPAAPGAPPLPQGADPALGSKPAVTAGKGDLTKLGVTSLIKGTGPATQAGQQITVNYVGVFYKTGEEFDASWKRGEPFSFQLGQGGVIPGWDQGLVGVPVGSRVQLDIPGPLAYGDTAQGGRPAGPLRFVVDVLAAR